MKTVYIYHHLGLGDHIIANGLVRTIAKDYERVYLFCKPHNFDNVAFLYKDLSKVKIIKMDDSAVRSFMSFNPDNEYLIIGHDEFQKIYKNPSNTLKIDEIFYKMGNVPIKNKCSEFHVSRDIEREKEVFKLLGLSNGEKYAFVHDTIDNEIIKSKPFMKIIKPINKSFSIFDYLYTIEHAEEIHCMNSSFFCLIDCMGIFKDNMFFHEYLRYPTGDSNPLETPILNSPWKILK